jgi:hypothetical protein
MACELLLLQSQVGQGVKSYRQDAYRKSLDLKRGSLEIAAPPSSQKAVCRKPRLTALQLLPQPWNCSAAAGASSATSAIATAKILQQLTTTMMHERVMAALTS